MKLKIVLFLLGVFVSGELDCVAQGTAFTYQGRLNEATGPVTGIYDLRFGLYDAASNGNAVGGNAITNAATPVTNGLFTVTLDFGAGVFNGAARWLDIAVRTNGGSVFTPLAPRLTVTPTPYALFTSKADVASLADAVLAPNIVGTMGMFQLPSGILTNNAGSVVLGGAFAGNGAALTNVNATSLSGLAATYFWQISGNSGTAPGINFLGTTDNQELNFKVNNTLGLRLLPGLGHPSVVGGDASNFAAPDCYNTFIGGGVGNWVSNATYYAAIGSGSGNQITKLASWWPDQAVIGGGINNTNAGYAAVIPGGEQNFAYGQYSFAAGLRAKAMHDGAFVWADTTAAGFNSTTNNQFLIRAAGGVGIGKNNPATALDVNGTITATGFSGNGSSLTGLSPASLSAGTAGINIAGNAATATSSTSFTGSLAGDVNGTQGATVVASVGGQTAANVAGGVSAANAATSGNVANTIVKRDAVGSFVAGTIVSTNFTGNGVGLTNLNAAGVTGTLNASAVPNLDASKITSGTLALAQLPGAVVTNNAGSVTLGGTFSGNGANVTNVNAASLGGLKATNFWQLGGNNIAAGQSIGSTNSQPLELIVGGGRALRMEWNGSGAPNLIGGSPANFASPGIQGAVIGGGGATNYTGGWQYTNSVASDFGTIGGGADNQIHGDSDRSTIGGGGGNQIRTNASYATISGGFKNQIQPSAYMATIGGGYGNQIQTNASASIIGGGERHLIQSGAYNSTIGGGNTNQIWASFSTISGGFANQIQSGASQSSIGGGYGNQIQNNADNSTIAGGDGNQIESGASFSMIGGGANNDIQAGSDYSTISGGDHNVVGQSTFHSTIGGGYLNQIQNQAYYATIGGGDGNRATNDFAVVPGGYHNIAGGAYSFSAGNLAQAIHQGTFVWADSQNANLTSTANNQFLIRAAGGVGIGKNNPATALDVNGTVTATSFSGDGSGLTGLTGANLNNGSVTAAKFAPNIGVWANVGGNLNFASGGNVGIGSTTPDYALTVQAADGADVVSWQNSTYELGRLGWGTDYNSGWMQLNNSGVKKIELRANGSSYFSGGNVGIGNPAPGNLLVVGGSGSPAYCNGTTWVNGSDRNSKEQFSAINPRAVLEKVSALAITEWKYKVEADGTRHLGPMAQDFHTAFGLNGADDRHIATVDESGVALAAIQGLNLKLEDTRAENALLKQQNDTLTERLHQLEAAVKALAERK